MQLDWRCAKCLYERQQEHTDNEDYLAEIGAIIDSRREHDTSPYLTWRFHQAYERHFGISPKSYKEEKKQFNDLVLSLEDKLRKQIIESEDPLAAAMVYGRIGNYIDFGAANCVSEEEFLSLFGKAEFNERDREAFESFKRQCAKARTFLLIADNCGEIVIDKLFLEQLRKLYPHLEISVMVRGAEAVNDVTAEDAAYVGIDKYAKIISNGNEIAGTVYEMCSDEAKDALDNTDVILAKGQGNYESMAAQGRHIFYSFLCKCDLFTSRYNVPLYTGIFTEEWE
ncbi:MAG: DUF89 family protein [Erysipelotrichaceae bacterium]|nr:DUF89 family protein [Erysipelotrichaceae bacterium]